MSEAIKLSAAIRQDRLRDLKDIIPAVIYGSGATNESLSVNRGEFEKVFAQSGESGLISLSIGDAAGVPVIIKDLQMDPVKHRIIHVDFYKVNMKEKVKAEVSLEFVGEAPAVKAFGGIVMHNFDTLEIECLPADLMQKVEVDMSGLKNIGDAIHISDIKLPSGVVFVSEPETMIAQVIEPKKTVEDAAADAALDAPAAEGEAKPEEKKEEKAEEQK